jgi:TatD DNase family protein
MKLIDTHCHPQMKQYDNDREEMIKRTLGGGVGMICVGVDLESSQKAIEFAEKNEGIWASVGLHPNDNLDEESDAEKYKELAQNKKVIAIGEIGLDYYRTPEKAKQEIQKIRFVEQIKLAKELNKPIIMHCRQAYDDAIEILKNNPVEGVAHSFTDTWDNAEKIFDLGFYIGFNGIITFTEQYDEIVRKSPTERILIETDAPYLAPVPYRGKRNEPAYVIEVAKKIAQLKNISFEEVAEQTTKNALKLFKLNDKI